MPIIIAINNVKYFIFNIFLFFTLFLQSQTSTVLSRYSFFRNEIKTDFNQVLPLTHSFRPITIIYNIKKCVA